MSDASKRKLLVEGNDDRFIIPELVEKNGIPWEPNGIRIVDIIPFNGIEELLKPDEIETRLKASDLEALGILVDADDNCAARWAGIKRHCDNTFPELPLALPTDGLITENSDGLRLGVWIMPDNQSPGMMETFLNRLVPDDAQQLLNFAEQCVADSRQHGAVWRKSHADKALVHTWLAWQDPPGRQLHRAVMQNQLKPKSESAVAFMAWFRRLYQLEAA